MEIKTIGVAGAGKMGQGIALNAAQAGYRVILLDRTAAILEKAQKNMEEQSRKLVGKKLLTPEERGLAMGRVRMTTAYAEFAGADLVIEVVPESLEIKTATLAQLDAVCKQEAILASGTSTFSITTLAAATRRPAQVAGMHFFIPPAKLVEITRGCHTSDGTVAQLKAVARQMGKVSVEVKKDSPGFIANRIYTPLFLEAFKVYEEGIASKEDIDLAMKCSYLPVGPFELADIIGLDILQSSLEYYRARLGPRWSPPSSLQQLVTAGCLGKKAGKGWYDYETSQTERD